MKIKCYIPVIVALLLLFQTKGIAQHTFYNKYGIDTTSVIPVGLSAGMKAPAFTARDDKGRNISLVDLLKDGPVVLFFYRGEWCPVCKRYLKQYRDSLDLVIDRGAHVVAVTPETPENVEITRKKTGFRFTVVSDPDRKIMSDYKVLFRVTKKYRQKIKLAFRDDIAEVNGDTEAWLPVPATYIINTEGIITARYFNPDYRDRASVGWILEHLPQ